MVPSEDPGRRSALTARDRVRRGGVVPAHPLALDANRRLDERRQRALTRYYAAAGASGIAVGVHTTQFAIREAGLLEPVLSLAAETLAECERDLPDRLLRVAGVCGPTSQAVAEAALARDYGYDAALVSLAGMEERSDEELVAHCGAVAEVLDVFGFYLQPAVGGRRLGRSFWRRLCELEALIAIKVAPFDRYATLDVVRAVVESGRAAEIALYTGNDDAFVWDLLSTFEIAGPDGIETVRMAGGLLGHWAVWTRRAVELFAEVRAAREGVTAHWPRLLALAVRATEANAALFDAAHGFRGCIAGLHHVLAGQGLLAGTWCLDPGEGLSPGQAEEIERFRRAYPEATDDDFVRAHLDEWLR